MSVPLAVMHSEEEHLVNGVYFLTINVPTSWRGEVQVAAGAGVQCVAGGACGGLLGGGVSVGSTLPG